MLVGIEEKRLAGMFESQPDIGKATIS